MKSHSTSTKGIIVFSIGFIIVLLTSGYLEPEVMVLHLFQPLIYVAVIILALKENKWGYGIGISISVFWNTYTFFSGFLTAGLKQAKILITTGTIPKPEHFIAVPAWLDHLMLIFCCVTAYTQLKDKKTKDILILLACGVISVSYLLSIIHLLWRKDFVPNLIHKVFG